MSLYVRCRQSNTDDRIDELRGILVLWVPGVISTYVTLLVVLLMSNGDMEFRSLPHGQGSCYLREIS
ncbi:unnamed protein product [Urochloa humidicola]